jgi:hypothetical protein
MTTQEIYFVIQAGLQLLVGSGVVWGVCWLGKLLKRALEVQRAVMQDYEGLNKVMRQVLDTVDAPAMIQSWRDYKALAEMTAAEVLKQRERQLREQYQAQVKQVGMVGTEVAGKIVGEQAAQFIRLIADLIPFIPPEKRIALIEASELPPVYKQHLRKFADAAPHQPIEMPANILQAIGQLRRPAADPPAQAGPQA